MSLVSEFIDAAAAVPFIVWAAIFAFGVAVWLAYEIAVAPLLTPEQEEDIARAHRELRGTRYEDVCTPPAGARRTGTRGSATMPRVSSSHSTRSTATRTPRAGGTFDHPSGAAGPDHGRPSPRRTS